MHKKTDFRKVIKNLTRTEKTILTALCIALVVGLVILGVLLFGGRGEEPEKETERGRCELLSKFLSLTH